MKLYLPTIIDTVFSAFATFVLALVTLNFFIDKPFAITFSAVFALLVSLIVFKHLSTRKEKFYLSKAEKEATLIMASQLNIYTPTEQTDLFQKALKKAGFLAERKRGFLYLKDKKSAIFCKFCFDGVTKTDIVKVFNTIERNDTAYILSETFTPEIQQFAQRFDGRIITVYADQVFRFLSDNDCLPPQKFVFKQNTPLKLSAFKNLWAKKKAKNHLIFGLSFLAMSYFVPIKIYYVIIGCLFLILALFCRLFGTEDIKKSTT